MDKTGTVLVVDDDADVLHTTRILLKPIFKSIILESNPQQINYLIKNKEFDVVILDMNYTAGATGGKEGLFWLKQIKDHNPNQIVIMMTAYGDIKLAVDAMKYGATDFIVKPWENEKFLATLSTAFELSTSKKEIGQLKSKQSQLNQINNQDPGLVLGKSESMKRAVHMAEKVARTDANVLLLGENGTGKEILARHIHSISNRNQAPFIKVDLGAISESLFESELFGHAKGAFTDAKEDKEGRLILAGEGTLFLDEIGNLSKQMQAKLLSVLQNRLVIPVGSNLQKPIQARIIAATNNNLLEMVENKTFREDLLYRLNTVEIVIPALRDRLEDIAILTQHYLNLLNSKYRKQLKISEDTIQVLSNHNWPGNVRELIHSIERAVIMADDEYLIPEDFLLKHQNITQPQTLNLDETEKHLIEKAILKFNGNISKAAKELGLGRTTIYRKMDKYGIKY